MYLSTLTQIVEIFIQLELLDAVRILPTVLSYLIRYPLGNFLAPFRTSFKVPLVPYPSDYLSMTLDPLGLTILN